jgi:hypothetical protein
MESGPTPRAALTDGSDNVSGDSDLAHAIELVKASSAVKVVDASLSLNRTIVLKSVMEDPVTSPTGSFLHCPPSWRQTP